MNAMKLKLIYPQEKIKDPIISKLCRAFEVEINIRKANVQEQVGWLELELMGKEEEIERAIQWLSQQGIDVSPIEGQVFVE